MPVCVFVAIVLFTVRGFVCVCLSVADQTCVWGVCACSKCKAAVVPIPCSLPETPLLVVRRGEEPQPMATPSPSLIGREWPPPSPAYLVCRRRSVCMRRGKRERGSSQCNGIEESEEEEEESE